MYPPEQVSKYAIDRGLSPPKRSNSLPQKCNLFLYLRTILMKLSFFNSLPPKNSIDFRLWHFRFSIYYMRVGICLQILVLVSREKNQFTSRSWNWKEGNRFASVGKVRIRMTLSIVWCRRSCRELWYLKTDYFLVELMRSWGFLSCDENKLLL